MMLPQPITSLWKPNVVAVQRHNIKQHINNKFRYKVPCQHPYLRILLLIILMVLNQVITAKGSINIHKQYISNMEDLPLMLLHLQEARPDNNSQFLKCHLSTHLLHLVHRTLLHNNLNNIL
jgi:hypothetical protein